MGHVMGYCLRWASGRGQAVATGGEHGHNTVPSQFVIVAIVDDDVEGGGGWEGMRGGKRRGMRGGWCC